jgi:hypothetical protein
VSPRSWAALIPSALRNPHEVANAKAAIAGFRAGGASTILLLTHDAAAARCALGESATDVRLFELSTRRSAIERARLVNHAARVVESDLIWVHDPCLVLAVDEIVPPLDRCDALAVQPQSAVARLDLAASIAYRQGRTATAVSEHRVAFGKGSFIVDRLLFIALGGLSESFVGAGDEGVELGARIKHFVGPPLRIERVAYELSAGAGAEDAAQRRTNKDLLARLTSAFTEDPDSYLATRLESSFPVERETLANVVATRQQLAAFRATSPHPPRVEPTTLRGSIWGVTAIFNPAGYRSKLTNFERFRAGMARAGLPLLTVELAFGDAPFQLREGDADKLVSLRGGDVLWQKERLLNVGVRALPADCDKVVWLDADILFEDEAWVAKTARALEQYVVVQPFSRSVRLLPGESSIALDALPVGSSEHQVLHSMAFGVAHKGLSSLSRYLVHGHCGYAWAARRSLLAKHGLYDANILGNGDLSTAHTMFGGSRYLKTERLSTDAARHLAGWAEPFYDDVRGSVGYLDGTVYHLWHGATASRRYIDRLQVLVEHDFDPRLDLAHDGGAYRWARAKPGLHAVCREYFDRRQEDG